jgi:hypothetical protein
MYVINMALECIFVGLLPGKPIGKEI